MKSGFKDPATIKSQKPKDKPIDGKSYPLGWDFRCPQYDQRSSVFVNTGTDYGTGIKQPIGSLNQPKQRVDTLPFGYVDTMQVSGIKVE